MNIRCTYCNKEFYRKRSQIKRSKNHFCSKECMNIWQKGRKIPERGNRVSHSCHQCDENILVENYKYKRFLKGEIKNLFCDKHCLAEWQKTEFKGKKSARYNSVEKKCNYCGETYVIRRSKKEDSKYCSHECLSFSKTKKSEVKTKCDYCNKYFIKKRHKIRNNNFCSKECSNQWNSENNNLRVSKDCFICKKNFAVQRGRADTAKTCSKNCHYTWLKEHYCKDDNVRERLIQQGVNSQKNKKYSETKPERILKEFLIEKDISFIAQHPMYDKFVVDFYLPESNMVIEVFGDYWHGNPMFYGDSANLKPLSKKQKKQKKKDKAREAYLKKCGHEFHILWEDDIYKNLNEITKFL